VGEGDLTLKMKRHEVLHLLHLSEGNLKETRARNEEINASSLILNLCFPIEIMRGTKPQSSRGR